MANQITAANFDETFNMDYVVALADGLSSIGEDSSAVSKLVTWCADRGYEVSREVCRDVIQSQIDGLTQTGAS
jgi:hypothetical protein